ncbi:MAG: hypothetical protein ACKE5M_00555 [Methylophilaceae bacterium]
MIVWQGFGFLAALIPIILLVLFDMGGTEMTYGTEAALIISAIVVYLVGRKLNSKPGKVLVDPETNQEVELKNKHTLFWIPMEWFGLVIAAAGCYTFIKHFI